MTESDSITMDIAKIEHYETDGRDIARQAASCQIVDAETRAGAIALSTECARRVKIVEAEFADDKQRAYDLWKSICARIAKLVDPYKTAKSIVDGEIARDWQVQEKLRREAEARERARAAEEERLAKERLAKEAEKALDEGRIEEAEVAMEEMDRTYTPFVPPASEAPKTQRSAAGSVTVVTDIAVEVVSPMALIRAIADGKLPVHLVSFQMGELKKYAKVTGAKELPGVRITSVARTSTRVA